MVPAAWAAVSEPTARDLRRAKGAESYRYAQACSLVANARRHPMPPISYSSDSHTRWAWCDAAEAFLRWVLA